MKLELITLTGEKLSEEVYEVTLPTRAGEISVFPGHETLTTIATDGVLYVRRKKSDVDAAREVQVRLGLGGVADSGADEGLAVAAATGAWFAGPLDPGTTKSVTLCEIGRAHV